MVDKAVSGKVIVLGSINVDLVAPVRALPRPGETVAGTDLSVFLGGKGANQAIAAARAGGDVAMIGAIGSQSFGLDIRRAMEGYGVEMSAVISVEAPTGAALIAVDEHGENSIVVTPGANALAEQASFSTPPAEAILLAQLELDPTIVCDRFRAAPRALRILNTAPAIEAPDDLFALSDVLIFNETELSAYARTDIASNASVDDIADVLRSLRRASAQCLTATLGARGAISVEGEETIVTVGRPAKAVDTTGAGDCFCGALAARLAEGADFGVALDFAAAAAALSVAKPGAAPSMPSRAEIEASL